MASESGRTLLGRCRRLGHCGYIDCICDVDPTDPRDMAALRNEEGDESVNDREHLFEDWWHKDGRFIDPDFSDVPWFDKRKGLAAAAFEAAMEVSRNYTADDPVSPDQFTFANGRVVTLADDGSCLRIGNVSHKPTRRHT